jgi:hypothetical protein
LVPLQPSSLVVLRLLLITAVTAAITGAGADVAIIGGAVLIVMVGIKVFKWARAAL